MSYDELPPNAEPPRESAEAAAEAARETSSSEPPKASSRRRPARSASTSSDGEKPARAPRARRTPPASPEEVNTPPAPPADSAPPDTPASETTARPSRRRRPAARPQAEAATETPAPPPEVSAPEGIAPEPSETVAPSRSTRRRGPRARNTAPPDEKPAPGESPPVEATMPPESAETTAPPEAEAAPGRPARSRRGGRGQRPRGSANKETAGTEPPLDSEAPSAEIESQQSPIENAETAESDAEMRGRRNRRERGGARRGKPPVEIAPEVALEPQPAFFRAPRAEPAEFVDLSVGAHLILRNGLPEIRINGVTYPPILFFGNVEGALNQQRVLSEARRAARAGVHLHSTLVELPCPLSEKSDALDEIDNRLRALLDADPDGYIMPRIVFVPARGWKREYPTEISLYADGTTGDPSLTGARFWQEAEHSLVALIAHIKSHSWGERIFGYHLERGEWFQPADQGYDRSIANRDAFRDWLRDKYKHNLVTLRAAWYDGDVQFHTAEIPSLVTKPSQHVAFFEARRERRIIDFNEFTSESTAWRLILLGRVIKKATRQQALVSLAYGYTLEFGHPFSGHLALGMLEDEASIDLITGPPSYRDRKPGGGASYPAPVHSPPLHGKLWLSEDDTKTYLAPAQQDPEDFNPRLGDRFVTEQAHARAMGRALANLTGIGWMDLWGEGWLDEDNLWERIGAFAARYRSLLEHSHHAKTPELVVLVDERSLLHVQRGEAFFRRLTNGLRDTLQRSGASIGIYLQSDLLAKDFPTDAKLYLFLTPYRLPVAHREAIKEKLQRGDKTLVWMYAPGSCEEIPSALSAYEETTHGAIGFTLRQQAWNSEVGSRILEPYHPITERLGTRDIGARERLNPSFYVADQDATVLAEYHGSGLPSLVVKNFGTWKSVFLGDPTLPLELLRGFCRYAGVHLWMPQGEDVVTVGNGWITVHAARDGQRTLYLPEATGLYDLSERRLIADEARDYRFFLRTGMTRAFCIGPTERFLRLGLPNITLPGETRERIVLKAAQEREARSNTAPSRPPRTDSEILEAVLTVDVSELDDVEITDLDDLEALESGAGLGEKSAEGAEEVAGEVMATGRRRRRRGGRGRWRKREENNEEGGSASGDAGESSPPPSEPGAQSDES